MTLDTGPPGLPVHPRPHGAASYHHREESQRPPMHQPPVPPLPQDFQLHRQDMYRSKSAESFVVPMPQRPMTYALDEHSSVSYDGLACFASLPAAASYAPRQRIQGQMFNHVHEFIPTDTIPSRGPAPVRSPPPGLPPQLLPNGTLRHGKSVSDVGSVVTRIAAASLNDPPASRIRSVHGVVEHSRPPIQLYPSSIPAMQPLAAPLPNTATLQNALTSVQSPSADVSNRVPWIRDVLLLVNRAYVADQGFTASSAFSLASNTLPSGPVKISDALLRRLAESAVSLLISIMPTLPRRDDKLTPPLAEALYIRGTLTASGAFPEFIAASPRNAFCEFEFAARAGFARAWFRLGCDYESVNDLEHARQCFDRGVSAGDPGCTYRLGMAILLGQLDFPPNDAQDTERAAELLHRAATSATIDFPHPPYVFALFLLGEFEKASIPPDILAAYIPAGSNAIQEARRHLERSAFLHFAPAQQRIGRAYEFAEPPFPFDPLLSVEYYSLASSGGDAQADLALSKWYLCGADGFFGKDETLAHDYAARAASHRLPAAMFAMGYYCEVGIGASPDINRARKWYEDAAALGDMDAQGRLTALTNTSVPLSREQHDKLAETRLVRSRTQARMRSNTSGGRNAGPSGHVTVPQQGQAYQRRQASLPSHVVPGHQYDSPVQSLQHRPLPQHSASLPAQHMRHQPITVDRTLPFADPRRAHQHQQSLSDIPRYSLVDPGVDHPHGSTSSLPFFTSSRRSTPTESSLPPMHRQYNGQAVFTSSPRGSPRAAMTVLRPETTPPASSLSTSSTRYATFADMGIEGKRAEDKECVIM